MLFSRSQYSVPARIALSAMTVAALAGGAQAQSKDSTIVRNDPVVIVNGARVSEDAIVKLQGVTAEVEILRGSKTKPFGDDAEGGVLQITTPEASTSKLNAANLPYGMARGAGGGTGGGAYGAGSAGGAPGTGYGPIGPMGSGSTRPMGVNGFPGQSPMDGSGSSSGYSSAPAAVSSGPAIYPIVVINGVRTTDNDLYKVKAKMTAKIEVLDSAAATAKYGKDASAGAILLTPVKEQPKAKAKSSSKSTPKKSTAGSQ